MTLPSPIHVIGGGLAGSEAAWQIARAGVPVVLHEMRGVPGVKTDAHHTDGLAELVCSNSFRSDDWEHNAVGLLHAEMRALDSIIMACGDAHQVPAGGALAVDRDGFSEAVTARLEAHPLVTIVREEIAGLPPEEWDNVIVATGPLTSPALAAAILDLTDEESLSFFDAIAPIVHADSIDFDTAWRQSRYDKEGPGGDAAAYVNCPMDKAQYEAFIDALLNGPKAEFREWENVPYFDGCLPIEVMAERGRETLRHGPMKPVGLTNPRDPKVKSYAIVQLRQDNALGTLFNMVGFQTKLKHGAQAEVFRMIPGLQTPSSPASAACTGTPTSTLRNCWTASCVSRPCPACASPVRSRASRAMSRAPPWACSPAASPPPKGWAGRWKPRPPTPPWGPWSNTSPAATSKAPAASPNSSP
jgi:methylenetetrahydrofolate--tRNA-(uracil-5-)-methyltransferase